MGEMKKFCLIIGVVCISYIQGATIRPRIDGIPVGLVSRRNLENLNNFVGRPRPTLSPTFAENSAQNKNGGGIQNGIENGGGFKIIPMSGDISFPLLDMVTLKPPTADSSTTTEPQVLRGDISFEIPVTFPWTTTTEIPTTTTENVKTTTATTVPQTTVTDSTTVEVTYPPTEVPTTGPPTYPPTEVPTTWPPTYPPTTEALTAAPPTTTDKVTTTDVRTTIIPTTIIPTTDIPTTTESVVTTTKDIPATTTELPTTSKLTTTESVATTTQSTSVPSLTTTASTTTTSATITTTSEAVLTSSQTVPTTTEILTTTPKVAISTPEVTTQDTTSITTTSIPVTSTSTQLPSTTSSISGPSVAPPTGIIPVEIDDDLDDDIWGFNDDDESDESDDDDNDYDFEIDDFDDLGFWLGDDSENDFDWWNGLFGAPVSDNFKLSTQPRTEMASANAMKPNPAGKGHIKKNEELVSEIDNLLDTLYFNSKSWLYVVNEGGLPQKHKVLKKFDNFMNSMYKKLSNQFLKLVNTPKVKGNNPQKKPTRKEPESY